MAWHTRQFVDTVTEFVQCGLGSTPAAGAYQYAPAVIGTTDVVPAGSLGIAARRLIGDEGGMAEVG